MTKKRWVVLIIICAFLLGSCGNDSPTATTITTTTTTTAATTTAAVTTASQTGKGGGVSVDLNDDFEGKFGHFKVSRDWGYASASINTTGDTTYFYLKDEESYPFLMYQYEIAEGFDTLSESDWNQIARNAGGKRISDRTVNNRKFARIIVNSPEDNMRMMIYYTFENQVLQGVAAVYLMDDTDEERYLDLLEKVVETFEIESDMIEKIPAGENSTSAENTSDSIASTLTPDGYREFEVEGGTLSLPAEYFEHTSDMSNGYMKGYSNADRDKLILYQYIDLGITEGDYALGVLDASFIDETIRLYAIGISTEVNESRMVGDKELYELVPYPSNTDKLAGYIYVDRKKGILRIILMSEKDMKFERIPEVLEFVQDLFLRFKQD